MNKQPAYGHEADLGVSLRELRLKQQATLEEVARSSSLSKAYISRVEHGERHPDREVLIGLLLAGLGLDVAQADLILQLAGYATLYAGTRARSAIRGQRSDRRTGEEGTNLPGDMP